MDLTKKICGEKTNIHIKNKELVADKIKKLVDGGKDSLQVISDFDMTLSRYSYNNKKCCSCHGVLETSNILTPEIREHLKSLKDKYYPLETDPNLSVKEKIPLMIEWWEGNHKQMEKCSLRMKDIEEAVANSTAMLRDEHESLFRTLDENGVPLLIFSAGIGDVLKEIIRQRSVWRDNMKVVANMMKFDGQGVMCGFEGKLIHTFNKNEGALDNSSYFDDIAERHNVILMGDSMGDLHMADGIKNINTCLKIGYLNHRVDEWLEHYMNEWDIVLVEDSSLDVAHKIIDCVIEN